MNSHTQILLSICLSCGVILLRAVEPTVILATVGFSSGMWQGPHASVSRADVANGSLSLPSSAGLEAHSDPSRHSSQAHKRPRVFLGGLIDCVFPQDLVSALLN